MLSDDLPWPELGNVSRGATRGNQGHKGVLGPADRDGRCVLQLRVQAGVLAVRLNRQSSDWYRALVNEVNRALKLTKTYWRKARRRQDYDARADQDHMELHEWLQQLKDKTMSHLELLMQKGDIQGPPYEMTDEIELTFLRKFIERQAAGIPHNPRLRNGMGGKPRDLRRESVESMTPEPSDHGYNIAVVEQTRAMDDGYVSTSSTTKAVNSSNTLSSPLYNLDLVQEANTSRQLLLNARGSLSRAVMETQEAFLKYTACLETEREARREVAAAERRRDDIMSALLSQNQLTAEQSRDSSVSEDERQNPPRYSENTAQHLQDLGHTADSLGANRHSIKAMEWPESNVHGVYSHGSMSHLEDQSMKSQRKHPRNWDRTGQMQDVQYACEDINDTIPPRKRVHHMMNGFDVLSGVALQTPDMTLS